MNKNKLKGFGNFLTNIILILSILLLVFSAYTAFNNKNNPDEAYLFGYKPLLVLTGSMEPEMMTNSLAIVKKAGFEDVRVGDIITYEIEDKLITHRVIDKVGDEISTKGDNNNTPDSYIIGPDNVKAKVVKIFNFTSKPITEIIPNGLKGGVNKIALAKWLGYPIFIIVVISLLKFSLRKIDEKYE